MSDQFTVEKAIELKNQGKKQEARNILLEVVAFDPGNIPAWFWLVELAPNDEQRLSLLQRCVRQNPSNAKALRALEWMQAKINAAAERDTVKGEQAADGEGEQIRNDRPMVSVPPPRVSLLDNLPDDPPPPVIPKQMVKAGPVNSSIALVKPVELIPRQTVTAPTAGVSRKTFSFQWLGIALTLLSLFLILIILIFGWFFRDLISPVFQMPTPTFLPADQSIVLWGFVVSVQPVNAGY